jgi:hypothetical protein
MSKNPVKADGRSVASSLSDFILGSQDRLVSNLGIFLVWRPVSQVS